MVRSRVRTSSQMYFTHCVEAVEAVSSRTKNSPHSTSSTPALFINSSIRRGGTPGPSRATALTAHEVQYVPRLVQYVHY